MTTDVEKNADTQVMLLATPRAVAAAAATKARGRDLRLFVASAVECITVGCLER